MATISSLPGMSRRIFSSPAILTRLVSSGSSGNKGNDSKKKTTKAPEKPEVKTTPPEPKAVKFDNTKYQVQQYYSYNDMSYYDIECEMSADRLPQPSKFAS